MTTKTKKAGVGNVGTEEVAELENLILNREDTKTQSDMLFEKSKKSRESGRKTVDSLFIQAPAAKTRGAKLTQESTRVVDDTKLGDFVHNMSMLKSKAASVGNFEKVAMIEKLAAAKNTLEFFEKKAYLTPAQKRFPELIKASAVTGFSSGEPTPTPTMKARNPASSTGPKPVRSSLSGGSN